MFHYLTILALKRARVDVLRSRLRNHYAAKAEMFMIAPPPFDELIAGIAELEAKLNSN